jgi:hypothetical protein
MATRSIGGLYCFPWHHIRESQTIGLNGRRDISLVTPMLLTVTKCDREAPLAQNLQPVCIAQHAMWRYMTTCVEDKIGSLLALLQHSGSLRVMVIGSWKEQFRCGGSTWVEGSS